METQNLTLRVPKALLQKAKRVAASRGTTLTNLVIEGLTRATSAMPEYDAAFARQRAMMHEASARRDPNDSLPARDETHER